MRIDVPLNAVAVKKPGRRQIVLFLESFHGSLFFAKNLPIKILQKFFIEKWVFC